jgi:hypothetical protein
MGEGQQQVNGSDANIIKCMLQTHHGVQLLNKPYRVCWWRGREEGRRGNYRVAKSATD